MLERGGRGARALWVVAQCGGWKREHEQRARCRPLAALCGPCPHVSMGARERAEVFGVQCVKSIAYE